MSDVVWTAAIIILFVAALVRHQELESAAVR